MRLKDIVFYSKEQLRDTHTKVNYLALLRDFRRSLIDIVTLEKQAEEEMTYGEYKDYHMTREEQMLVEGLARGILIAIKLMEQTLEIENEGISKKFVIRQKDVDKY